MLEKTHLPSKSPEKIIVTPSMNRWGNEENQGPLPNMLHSVVNKLEQQGDLDSTMLLVSDATDRSEMHSAREEFLNKLMQGKKGAEVYVMTPETQKQVVSMLCDATRLDRTVVQAIVEFTGYANQRAKLDVVVAGQALGEGQNKKVLTLDDDTLIPDRQKILRVNEIDNQYQPLQNSQTLLSFQPDEGYFDYKNNRLNGFFDTLGMTVGEVRGRLNVPLRSSYGMHDTMHQALEDVIIQGSTKGSTQFVVSENQRPLENENEAVIAAAVATKYGVPDYRTVRIAKTNLMEEFPEKEVNIVSYPSGPSADFVFQRSWTNVDSACMSRLFNQMTALYPWWFISHVDISKQNPLKVVTAHYRADNEFLPVLFKHIRRSTGANFVYQGGIDSQVSHHRARSGYRPELIEQATASLVGNVAALEAIKYIDFSGERPKFSNFSEKAFRENLDTSKIYDVFKALEDLKTVCEVKSQEVRARLDHPSSDDVIEINKQKLKRYEAVIDVIHQKTDGFNYHSFKTAITAEVYEQLAFYSKVLTAFPIVVDAVRDIIAKGEYPVMRARSA